MVLGLLAGACGGDDAESGSGGGAETTTTEGQEAAIDRDATIHFAATHQASQLDPHRERDGSEFMWNQLLFDRLLYVDSDKELQPMLAEEWEFSEDGLTLTLTIREGATFHDGSPIDAEAAKASIERAMTMEGSTQAPKLSAVSAVEAPDVQTLVLTLTQPDSSLLYTLASSAGALVNPSVIAAGTDIGQDPGDAGSGAYTLGSFAPGDSAVYERYEDYWDPEAANFASIELSLVSDQNTRLNGVRSGEYDATLISESLVAEGESLPDSTVTTYLGDSAYTLFMKPVGALADVEVRQAIRYAIDREAIAEGLFEGKCPVAEQPFRRGLGHIEDFEDPYSFDQDKAKDLLATVGSPEVTVEANMLAGVSPMAELGEVIQQQLAEVGITLNLTPLEAPQAVISFRSGEYAAMPQVLIGRTHPKEWVSQSITGAWNFAGDEGGNVAELAEQAVDPSLSEEDSQALFEEIVQEVTDQAWYAPVCYRETYIVWPDDIVNADLMANGWATSFDFRYLGRSGD